MSKNNGVTDAIEMAVAWREGARRDGNGWRIPCPAHHGEHPNCYVGPGDDGGVVARCWSRGCSYTSILDALGLTPDKNARHFVVAYHNRDGQNRNVFRIEKEGGKTFRGKGSPAGTFLHLWAGVEDDSHIVIVEGEKAAQALLDMRIDTVVPASWRGGAGGVDKADYSPVEGRSVVVWPDNDAPGAKMGLVAARMAQRAGAAQVRMVDVSHLPAGADAADVDRNQAFHILASAMEMPEPNSHGGAREGAGRPGADAVVQDALAHLTTHHAGEFLDVGDVAHVRNGAVYRRLDGRDNRARKLVYRLLEPALADANALTGKVLRSVCESDRRIVSASDHIAEVDFDDRERHPLVPFTDGTGYDLRAGKAVTEAEGYLADHGWEIQAIDLSNPPDWADEDIAQAFEIIERQYGGEVMRRIATYFLGISKSIDVIRLPSGAGKTTLFDLLNRAFPGAWGKENAAQIVKASGQFTPFQVHLSNKIGMFLDEATQGDATIPTSLMNSWDAEFLEIEEKYAPRRSARRIASICLMASDDWPHIDASAQGVKGRILWAIDRQDAPGMTSDERALLLSDKVVAAVRHWILSQAYSLLCKYGSAREIREMQEGQPEAQAGVKAFFAARENPAVTILKDAFEQSDDYEAYVTVADVKEILKEGGIEKVAPRDIPKWLGIAIGLPAGKTPEADRPRVMGKKTSVYRRVSRK